MTRARRRAAAAVLLLGALAAACSPGPVETRQRFTAMGTIVDVTVYDHPEDDARAAIRAVEALFRRYEVEWNPWEADSAMARVNAALAEHREIRADADLRGMLERASELNTATGGLFDPAVGGLIRLWGFHDDERPPVAPPAPERIKEWLASARPFDGVLADGLAEGEAAPVIDLGGFAKGEAVDRAIDLLTEAGITNAIVNAGGDLRAVGDKGDRGWRIGIRNPRGEGVIAAIEIESDESVFTSGDYERYFELEGRRYHHILDPRTGYPAAETVSVTVLHSDAATADAAATALFVAGPDGWPETAGRLGLDTVMLMDRAGRLHMTPAMQERLWINREAGEREILLKEPGG